MHVSSSCAKILDFHHQSPDLSSDPDFLKEWAFKISNPVTNGVAKNSRAGT